MKASDLEIAEKMRNTHMEDKILNSTIRKKQCLDNELAHALQLEAAMFELQKEFRNRSRSISENVGQLGNLLGLNRVA